MGMIEEGLLQGDWELVSTVGLIASHRMITGYICIYWWFSTTPLSTFLYIPSSPQVYSTRQLFRSSPFFQAIAKAYNDEEKSELFFKLHELQTCSWGASQIGRVAQVRGRCVSIYLSKPCCLLLLLGMFNSSTPSHACANRRMYTYPHPHPPFLSFSTYLPTNPKKKTVHQSQGRSTCEWIRYCPLPHHCHPYHRLLEAFSNLWWKDHLHCSRGG